MELTWEATMVRTLICGFIIAFSLTGFASETAKGVKKDYENFKTEMSAKLDSVEKQIDELRAKAKQKGNAAQEESAANLEKSRTKLKADLEDVKQNSNDAWSKFKKGFAESVDSLNAKIQKAAKD